MIEFIKTKKTYVIAIAVLFLLVSLSDTTYSLFLKSDSTEEFTYNTGLLDLQFVEDKQLNLKNAFPMYDSEAERLEPYNLTIKNTGNIIYYFDLKMVPSEKTNIIDSKYIKVKVNDNLPNNLAYTDNVIISNVIIHPGEEITFRINIWLDINTPNSELGKTFSAKVITAGNSIYKTLDSSGANHPNITDDMVPVNYTNGKWHIADKANMNEKYLWYDYDKQIWANTITLKNSEKIIHDITRNNDLKINNIKYNNGNIIIDEDYLDIGLANYNHDAISTIIRVKFNDTKANKIYLISNGKLSYYYDNTNKQFILKNGNKTVSSSKYEIEKNKWYILGYAYNMNKVTFYLDGSSLSSSNIDGNIVTPETFKIGTDETFKEISKITVGNVLIYNKVLSNSDISKNYKTSIQVIYDGLITGYDEFVPMTLKEYYQSRNAGFEVNPKDVKAYYVWIPRFKYRVWNVTGENNTDTYNAMKNGVEITFENTNTSSGAIFCSEDKCFSNLDKTIEVTKADNDKYYTHTAFTNVDEELTGFWVSKYEVSIDEENIIESNIKNEVWRDNYLSNYYENIKKINIEYDYHVIKNTEWGAITYLSNSKFGVCKENTCQKIEQNKTYISGNNEKDTTTGNNYGVFDMAGSALEYTMANISQDNNLNLNNSYFKNIPIGTNDYDLYHENTFILGDATREISTKNITNSYNWIVRGGNSIFDYDTTNDIKADNISTRIVIK